ncbi:MAG: hypothetical protein J0L66_10770 [Cytophagales bacterium]|nr:hypothetical protein [Cytophagales bacterium]
MNPEIKSNPDQIQFRTPAPGEWTETATQELNGENPLEKLSKKRRGFVLKPYYTKPDTNQLTEFQLPASGLPAYGPRAWYNLPAIRVTNEPAANAEALHYLSSGADGILFVPAAQQLNFKNLLSGISVPHCALSLLIEPGHENHAEQFLHSTANQNSTGCIFYRQPGSIQQLSGNNSITMHSLGICVAAKENLVEELTQALEDGLAVMDRFTAQGHAPATVAQQMAFHFYLDSDFFSSIAKLKAFKKLWATLLTGYEVAGEDVYVHATSRVFTKETLQPHSNLIKSTTAALAAIAGGSNYLTVLPESDAEPGNRAARLVSAILRDESHLAKVADPTAGSYFLEALIHQLAENAWQKFLTRVGA